MALSTLFLKVFGKERGLKEIAIYGKGGIGKSTMSANISAAIASKGKKVLQIGCDPKHDSTRLLLGGEKINTVLDYIRKTGVADYKLSDILATGYKNIGCIEAGGPEPGVGCAGRGIITAFELLDKFHLKENYDIVLYDVLGDVVCGGFAVPIRREYSDLIFVVTSGEYMSLYAANNILRGIKNYDKDKSRVAGIIYNSRNVKKEDERLAAFSKAVDLPIFAKVPRSDVFAKAERENKTVTELGRDTEAEIYDIFSDMADRILQGLELYEAKPVTDEELEALIIAAENNEIVEKVSPYSDMEKPVDIKKTANDLATQRGACDSCIGCGQASSEEKKNDEYDAGYISKNVLRDEPLHGCAFNGAMGMASHINDIAVIAHSPKSCLYLSYQSIASAGRRGIFERGVLLPSAVSPNIIATDMNESDMIFGATEKLLDMVQKIKQMNNRPRAIVVITSCPAGIIGDDTERVMELSDEDCPVVLIKSDGNLTGDFLQGMLMSYTQLAKNIINPDIKPQKGIVNIVFEKTCARNTEKNFQVVKSFLQRMGVRVNCRYLFNTSYESVEKFCSAELNLLAYKDYTGNILKDFFEKKYDCQFFDMQFPTGFAETSDWLRKLGEYFQKKETAESIIEENRQKYLQKINEIKSELKGKKLFVVTYNHELDWIIQTALDLEMEIVKLGIINFSQDEGFRTRIEAAKEIYVEENYEYSNLEKDLGKLKPDILLSNYETGLVGIDCFVDVIPMCPDNGFFSGIAMAEKWKELLSANLEGEWKNDKELFDKYNA